MKKFIMRLLFGKDAAALFSENQALKAQVELLKKQLGTIYGQNPADKVTSKSGNPALQARIEFTQKQILKKRFETIPGDNRQVSRSS